MDEEREEYRRLERVAVGRICGCKSCICCEELSRDTAMKKWLANVLLNTKTDPQFVPPKKVRLIDKRFRLMDKKYQIYNEVWAMQVEEGVSRKATLKILESVQNGLLDRDKVIMACLKYMSEAEVAEMARDNEFFIDEGQGDEPVT